MKDDNKCRLAEKKVFIAVNTKSLNKLEKIIEKNPNHEYKYSIAILAYYRKKDKLNKLKHPNLIKLSDEFEKALKLAQKDDPYYQHWDVLNNLADKRENSKTFKIEARRLILEIIAKEHISIKTLTEESKLKYSNVYNFLEKEIYSDVSPKAVHKLIWTAVAAEQGWSSEEKISKFFEKWEILKDYWEEK